MDVRKSPWGVKILIYLVMFIFTVLAIYPILWLVIQSFKTTQEYLTTSKLALPKLWFPGNYPYAWKLGKFGMLLLNSLFYTIVTVMGVVVFGFMAGFAFAKIKNKATPLLHGMFIVGILITLQSIMVPLFLMVNTVHLYDTRLGILIPYIGIGLPMGVYLSTEYIRHIPEALIESARLDGTGYLKTFFFIIFPMSAPVAMTVGILTFTGTWNEFMLINILAASDTIKSIPVGVGRFSGALASDYGKQFSALVIGLIPMLLFYLIFRRQITKGVAAGAVKG
ncbi:ABC transporter, permease protein [Treponema primitia ZAS-2]|uniref:sn-glycerol-3-phosphate transport system permease protein UgpE n=1 Tax=Treponema primitia (strain ATCC BAA-887 / DSM 12427 / ZAS-2) TaxID=545694 RepID=F5YNT9_TREPZ|nr:carbohydrate ABC transporter permease [Treponema primitia]AEF84884.1 ABC transporter, permease protein [Treponema primitia ZAS-2]